jgi:predicted ATPase
MKEILYIENFGPVKKAELDLKQAMVFIGPQSSGKSAIAKLISIIRDWRFVNQQKSFEELLQNFNISSFITDLSVIQYESRNYRFTYSYGKSEIKFDDKHKLFLLERKLEDLISQNALPSKEDQEKEVLQLRAERDALKNEYDKEDEVGKKTGLFKKMEELNKALIVKTDLYYNRLMGTVDVMDAILQFTNYSKYIPSERLLIAIYSSSPFSFANSNLPIPKNILEFGALFEQARNKLKEFNIPFLNFKYAFEGDLDVLYYDEAGKTRLSESSSGLQSLVPMLLVIADHSSRPKWKYSYVVEEPEQNLYPLTQQKLVYHLAHKCLGSDGDAETRSNLVITTHSPYVLTSFNNLLFAQLVAQKTHDTAEVAKIIPAESWIKAEDFNAYFVADGGVEQIFNEETGLIDENQLDSASEEIMTDFNALMELYKTVKA